MNVEYFSVPKERYEKSKMSYISYVNSTTMRCTATSASQMYVDNDILNIDALMRMHLKMHLWKIFGDVVTRLKPWIY